MCLILFAWNEHPDYRLVLAANRDEFHERPTRGIHWWEDFPELLAGRDLKAGGSWMGVNRSGKFAAITNYRQFPITQKYTTSRGELVKEYLANNQSAEEFIELLKRTGKNYEGFNLIIGNLDQIYYYSNRSETHGRLQKGIYGLSNHLLDTPWPKIKRGKAAFAKLLENNNFSSVAYFDMLSNKEIAKDEALPDTGIGLEKERWLSSMFIDQAGYGTRSSTVLTMDHDHNIRIEEKGWIPSSSNRFEFNV